MKTSYRFIDAMGDEIDPVLFAPNTPIPVAMHHVTLGVDMFEKDGKMVAEDVLIITLRYLHDA